MNRLSAAIRAAVVTLFALFVLFYFAMLYFYSGRFICGTYINEKYVTGLSVEQANELLLSEPGNDYTLTITESGNSTERISGEDIDAAFDYTEQLSGIMSSESPFLWPFYTKLINRHTIGPEVTYDEKKAQLAVLALDICSSIPEHKAPDVTIEKAEDGTYVLNDTARSSPDREKLVKLLLKTIRSDARSISISDNDYYSDYEYSSRMLKTIDEYSLIKRCQDACLTISDNSCEFQLSGPQISGLIMTDRNGDPVFDVSGSLQLDPAKVHEKAQEIYDRFTTAGKCIYWKKYSGGTVSINSGIYGKTVDIEKEEEYISDAVMNGKIISGSPVYSSASGNALSADDISDTYIEVDMTAQKLYYIKDGRLFMESDVVTGALRNGRETPQMMAYIYQMQKNRVLVGENYRTPVKYWMAVHGHIGLHDADWRSSFGGSIYEKSGSHGCINLPPDFAEKLYENVHVGLPVICYY